MGLHHPPHPGRSIRRDCLDALGLTVTDGAKILRITRHMLSRILNGQAGISPEMAIRLEKAFGGTAQSWLALQQAYDLAQVKRGGINVQPAYHVLKIAIRQPVRETGIAISEHDMAIETSLRRR